MTQFRVTPEDAWPLAEALIAWLGKHKFAVSVEPDMPSEAPLIPTLKAEAGGLTTFYEVQASPSIGRSLIDLSAWMMRENLYAELLVATGEDSPMPARLLGDLKKHGMGLCVVARSGQVERPQEPRVPALMAKLDPTLPLGPRKATVDGLVQRFNEGGVGGRKDALRDLSEVLEDETARLLEKAAGTSVVSYTQAQIDAMPWENRINVLASNGVIDDNLKNDLHSFRGARNLLGHRVRSRREEKQRQQQFLERMAMGSRIIANLLSIKRKL